MAQDKAFVAEITEMLSPLDVRSRPMFGSYGMYCDDKFVAIISDGQLFLKQSEADPELFSDTEMAQPYPGAKDYHLVTADMFGDGEWLREAVQATADALLEPTPKKAKARE